MFYLDKKDILRSYYNKYVVCELIIDQLVRFFVVELAHWGSSSRLDTGARIFLIYSRI
jgi:hypothetical protein